MAVRKPRKPAMLAITLPVRSWQRIARACHQASGCDRKPVDEWSRCRKAAAWIDSRIGNQTGDATIEAPVDSWTFAASCCVQVNEYAGRDLIIALSENSCRKNRNGRSDA